MHLTIENLINLDYIIQEPPKHVDYLPLNPADPNSEWDVINVSAKSNFNVEFGKTQETTVRSTSTDTSSHSIGGSAELDVKYTRSSGSEAIAKVTTTVEVDAKLSYDYESSKSEWNSSYGSRKISFTSTTDKDDLVAGKMQLFDIWRYPVIGYYTSDPDTPYRMYEVILPGPIFDFGGGGLIMQTGISQPIRTIISSLIPGYRRLAASHRTLENISCLTGPKRPKP
jgi:hypothetical protein